MIMHSPSIYYIKKICRVIYLFVLNLLFFMAVDFIPAPPPLKLSEPGSVVMVNYPFKQIVGTFHTNRDTVKGGGDKERTLPPKRDGRRSGYPRVLTLYAMVI
jgi:hypothetical protein